MQVSIINTAKHPLPQYKTDQAAGMDVCAVLSQDLVLQPLQRFLVPTGLYIALPIGTEAQMRPRSGLAVQKGLTCLNSPGTIDSDYRGELKVLLVNLSNETQTVSDGDRIAQLVFAKHETVEWQLTNTLPETNRGQSGFGSTGQ
jgi:dUTP pyrophosphatase